MNSWSVAPFAPEQVERFIVRWYEAAAPAVGLSLAVAQARGSLLRQALQDRPYLADLASRPLLLTLMATLHSSWGELPADRADLYEETVELLLERWQGAWEGERGRRPAYESASPIPREYAVYKRTGLPCRTCGTRIRARDLAGRTLYWCGRCQRRR